jgi:ATP-dependent Lhr-like helicase
MDLSALEPFHPLIRDWFLATYRAPTEIQARAWPLIASGRHLLATAPTGSGKTLCAFLWALDRLASGAWLGGGVRVLYVSPLKALNNDIRRNLLGPLRRIEERFAASGATMPPIRVQVRSGDTPMSERRQMLRRPPEILITTPESLNLLLSSPRARGALSGLRTVILDEIHAVASTKRGTHLITAVERLVPLSGEFQRLALSATVRPLARVAAFVGGYRMEGGSGKGGGQGAGGRGEGAAGESEAGNPGEAAYHPREVAVVQDPSGKLLEVTVRFPDASAVPAQPGQAGEASIWPALVAECRQAIHAHRSTLLFTNTRRHAEKLARLINEAEGRILAYAHHGSLAREIRAAVEARLKRGELKAIVATSSLELGIDIGELDQVLLVQTPFSVSSTLQRIGRAGHAVDRASRGVLLALHGRDLLEAAVMARAVLEQRIEEARPVLCPLDVLAQVVLSMVGVERWDIDRLFAALRSSYPYHELTRRQFERVLDLLAGRYADSRIRELESRVSIDRLDNTIEARRGALPLVYRAGGTIPDRGYYDLRLAGSRARIGELDEEFVWERRVGDTFMFGTQSWRILDIDSRSVEVAPWDGPLNTTPFWRAERGARDFSFCARIGELLERWSSRLDDPEFLQVLMGEHCLERGAAESLVDFLKRQRRATNADLPHRHHLLLERIRDPSAGSGLRRLVLHTLWGARVNEPLALALAAAWQREQGTALEIVADDDCLAALVPEEADLGRLLGRLAPEELEGLLRRSLESSGFFGARFREAAGRALLLPRSDFRRRVPLWLIRSRSKKLLEAVLAYEDFPILAETWRECLQDAFDLEQLKALLGELARGEVRLSEVATAFPSPFAQGVSWIQINRQVYGDDTPEQAARSALRSDVILEALGSERLRPRLDPAQAADLQSKLQRTAPGYAPRDARELLDWLKERILVPEPEWRELLEGMRRDHGLDPQALERELEPKLSRLRLPGAEQEAVLARETRSRLLQAVGKAGGEEPDRLGSLICEWLRFYGPIAPASIHRLFGIPAERLEEIIEELVEEGVLIRVEAEVCDAQNLELLLRRARKARRPSFRALPADRLPLLLAVQSRLVSLRQEEGRQGEQSLKEVLENLFGYPAPAELWEGELFPARLPQYSGAWLDRLLSASDLRWVGCGPRRLTFCFESDLELFREAAGSPSGEQARRELEKLLPSRRGRYTFWDLQEAGGLASAELVHRLWAAAWRGWIASDRFESVRQGLGTRFTAEPAGEPASGGRRRGGSGRAGYDRWRAARPSAGAWFALQPFPEAAEEADALEQEDLARDRVRQLLRRYGILFRELLERELPPLRWPAVFRALRLMELAGEVLSGHFFEGIQGLQFLQPSALPLLEQGLPEQALFWLSAQDPASPCGLGLPLAGLPPRQAGAHLVFLGPRLLLASRARGRALQLFVPPQDPLLPRALELFRAHFQREYSPWNSVRVAQINGQPARASPFRGPLLELGFTEEYRGLVLRARY